MRQHISSTNAAAWVEHITLASSPQIKRAKEVENFTQKSHSLHNASESPDMTTRRLVENDAFDPRQGLITTTREGRGLLAYDRTHVIQQSKANRLPHGRSEADSSIQPQRPDIDMVLTAPFNNSLPINNIQLSEAEVQANEQLLSDSLSKTAKSPHQINIEEVANKVYRLMQFDLILERERATKMGG